MTGNEDSSAQGGANFPLAPPARILRGAAMAALLATIATFLPGFPAAEAQTPGSTRLQLAKVVPNPLFGQGTVSVVWSDDNGASWSPWTDLGAPSDAESPGGYELAGTPAMISDGYEHLYVFAASLPPSFEDPDPGYFDYIWYNTAYSHGAAWNGWKKVPGIGLEGTISVPNWPGGFRIVSSPAVASWGPGRVDLFVVGESNLDGLTDVLLHTWADNDTWSGTWESLDVVSTEDTPAVVSWGSGRLDLFVRWSDNGLYHKSFDQAPPLNGQWSGWEFLGGFITNPPVVGSPGYGRLNVVERGGGDGHLWSLVYASGWGIGTDVGCPTTTACLAADVTQSVATTSLSPLTQDSFVIGTDHALYRKTYNANTGWSAWQLVDASNSYTNIAAAGWVPIAPPPPPPSGGGGGGGSGGGGGGGGGCHRPCVLPP